MKQSLTVELEVSSEKVTAIYELWDKIVEVLTDMEIEKRIEHYHVSLGMPE